MKVSPHKSVTMTTDLDLVGFVLLHNGPGEVRVSGGEHGGGGGV